MLVLTIYQIAVISGIQLSLASAVERQMFEEYVTRAQRTGEAKEKRCRAKRNRRFVNTTKILTHEHFFSFRLEPQATRAKLIRKQPETEGRTEQS